MPKEKRKPGRPKKKSNAGRPTVITENTLFKLEEAFAIGATDTEACFFADISTAALYSYQRENPEYINRKEALKDSLVLKARNTIAKDMPNPGTSKWYLERKRKDEFGQVHKVEATLSIEDAINAINEAE